MVCLVIRKHISDVDMATKYGRTTYIYFNEEENQWQVEFCREFPS